MSVFQVFPCGTNFFYKYTVLLYLNPFQISVSLTIFNIIAPVFPNRNLKILIGKMKNFADPKLHVYVTRRVESFNIQCLKIQCRNWWPRFLLLLLSIGLQTNKQSLRNTSIMILSSVTKLTLAYIFNDKFYSISKI